MTSSTRSKPRIPKAHWLARHPVWGVAMLIVGAVTFVALGFNVRTNGPLTAWDLPVANDLHDRAVNGSELGRKAAVFAGTFGKESAGIILAVVGVYCLWRRQWRPLIMLVIGVLGGNTWFEVLSGFFMRQRPVFPDPLDPLPGPGFPSGHSMMAFLLYSLLAYLAMPRLSRAWRWVVVIAAVALPLLVGFSRMFLGAHYLTDVIGGYAFGMLWGGLAYTTLEVFFYKRAVSKAAMAAAIES